MSGRYRDLATSLYTIVRNINRHEPVTCEPMQVLHWAPRLAVSLLFSFNLLFLFNNSIWIISIYGRFQFHSNWSNMKKSAKTVGFWHFNEICNERNRRMMFSQMQLSCSVKIINTRPFQQSVSYLWGKYQMSPIKVISQATFNWTLRHGLVVCLPNSNEPYNVPISSNKFGTIWSSIQISP